MKLSLGLYLRQLRRQQCLTQTELGGTHFSKSYVSAVERNKILPSQQAIHFFAEQLGQPLDALQVLYQQAEQRLHSPSFPAAELYDQDEPDDPEVVALLDLILKGKQLQTTVLLQKAPAGSPVELLAAPSLQRQARSFFLQGLIAQERGDLPVALSAFEYALAFAAKDYQPAILDALGMNYYHAGLYQTALSYHQRALQSVQESEHQAIDLLLSIERHCGDDYRALGSYRRACEYYERARQRLRASHNIEMAADLYLGLGYCTYAMLFQNGVFTSGPGAINGATTRYEHTEQAERLFQQAVSYLIQSRMLYQVSSDRQRDALVRLTHAMVLHSYFSSWRQLVVREQAHRTRNSFFVACSTLIDEATEQCRQIILNYQEMLASRSEQTTEETATLSIALAYLLRAFGQRARLARMEGYTDTSLRERLLALHLCDQCWQFLTQPTISWLQLQEVLNISGKHALPSSHALPAPPNPSLLSTTAQHHPLLQTEVFFAIGEIVEETGRAGSTEEFVQDCYHLANQYLQAALDVAGHIQLNQESDRSALLRTYQRCFNLLEERMAQQAEPSEQETCSFIDLLKDAFFLLQQPVFSSR